MNVGTKGVRGEGRLSFYSNKTSLKNYHIDVAW